MRKSILLFVFFLFWQVSFGQETADTIKSLIITECRLHPAPLSYLELTNMGDDPVELNKFKIGTHRVGQLIDGKMVGGGSEPYAFFTDEVLQPGESIVLAARDDYGPEQFALGDDDFGEKAVQDNMWDVVDMWIDLADNQSGGDPTDSIHPMNWPFQNQWQGADGFYLQQNLSNGDSCVVDQVAGMFLGDGGQQLDRTQVRGGYDVAGLAGATAEAYLIRKFNVKQGELNFADTKGTNEDDGAWIVIPREGDVGAWRLAPWTVGNHGNYNFDENTLVSDIADVDVDNMTITVPWGVRRNDAFMSIFEEKPGIGWSYKYNDVFEDSLSTAAHTNDSITIYVCGDDRDTRKFKIIVDDPTDEANIVVPVYNGKPEFAPIESGYQPFPRVSEYGEGMDTIYGPRGGIPYATRIDTLLERLEKPANASWEIVYAGDESKPDLSNGDILKVTSENGSVKEYYISVNEFEPSDNADLASITWPDIPEFYKGILGWTGDTIPGFSATNYIYNLTVPVGVNGLPALYGKPSSTGATVELERAKGLKGTMDDRTSTFTVVAADKETTQEYKVTMQKAIAPENVQPYEAEPFFSQIQVRFFWSEYCFIEIANPGNQPLDLSDYMILGWNGPVANAFDYHDDNWMERYLRYIPGYKWPVQEEWESKSFSAIQDLSVDPIINPGDVFVMASLERNNGPHHQLCNAAWDTYPGGNPWISEPDVHFNNHASDCYEFKNQWGEEIVWRGTPMTLNFGNSSGVNIGLYKILNDSVKDGTKLADDPNDFRLIDIFGGSEEKLAWNDGESTSTYAGQAHTWIRQPSITEGDTMPASSLGLNDNEWEWNERGNQYWGGIGTSFPWNMLNVITDMGKHYFIPPTTYKSTISSMIYIASEGFSMDETLIGVKTGTSVADFIDNLILANEEQKLTVLSGSTELGDADNVSDGDILKVISADETNETHYTITVTDDGLSPDAVITSDDYTVEVTTQPNAPELGAGLVSGIAYGTLLEDLISNITLPDDASLSIIDDDGLYVPLKKLNYDTIYVKTVVNPDIYLEVIAQDGVNGILYQLKPESQSSDAFVTSNIFTVNEGLKMISLVPKGITTENFLANVVACEGATMKVVDKAGNVRTDAYLKDDDRLLVTSEDGSTVTTYFIATLNLYGHVNVVSFVYLISDMYQVDQGALMVDDVQIITPTSLFLDNVTLSEGASAAVLDADGNEKANDANIVVGDQVVVSTGSDESLVEVTYTINSLRVGKNQTEFANQIQLYPNPSDGNINVFGLERGQQVKVFNVYGSMILQKDASGNHEQISIDAQPAGIYMIVVSDSNKLIGKYKAIKR